MKGCRPGLVSQHPFTSPLHQNGNPRPEISDLRALLRDRQTKEGARGTATYEVCLDQNLQDRLVELRDELEVLHADQSDDKPADKNRMVAPPADPADTSSADELNTLIAEAEQAVHGNTLKIILRSLSSLDYQALANRHPDADSDHPAEFANWQDELIAESFHELWLGDDRQPIEADTLEQIQESLSFGEWEPLRSLAYVVNRRKVDVPFSSKPSAKTR